MTPNNPESDAVKPPNVNRIAVWLRATGVAAATLLVLSWLLGLIIWLPLYSGLFGFIVAGLIAGGISFRFARPLRPAATGGILVAAAALAFINSTSSLYWEFHHVANRAGRYGGFDKLRIKAAREGRPRAEFFERATSTFRQKLAEQHAPGGLFGYAQWCFNSGELRLEIDDASDVVTVPHRGWAWAVRTAAGFVLTLLGIWFSFEALRSPSPVSNTIGLDEEYEEID